MSKHIYCIGKKKNNQSILNVALGGNELNKKIIPAKRVDIVSIRMVKEGSLLYKNRNITSPNDAYNLIKEFLESSDREQLIVCCLDTKNQPTAISIVSIGSLNSSIVHPRELFKSAILSNAASIIVAHNHPSGNPEPSSEDINITKRLNECGNLLGIDLIDHIIIGDVSYVSLKEKGII
jgi:DNA repair protein RadC